LKIKERHIFRHYRNEKIYDYIESLPEKDRAMAALTISFIRETFPECEEILRGEIIGEEEL